jgi:hypothetical protein
MADLHAVKARRSRFAVRTTAIVFILCSLRTQTIAVDSFKYNFNTPPLLAGPQSPTKFRCTVVNTCSCPVTNVALG